MSLWIEVYVGSRHNRKLVAQSVAHNVSDLQGVSDYEWSSEEFGEPALNIPRSEASGRINGHARKQSVWALVARIAWGSGA